MDSVPRKKHSAVDVEREHRAVGWTGFRNEEATANVVGAISVVKGEDANKSAKKRKKKKKNSIVKESAEVSQDANVSEALRASGCEATRAVTTQIGNLNLKKVHNGTNADSCLVTTGLAVDGELVDVISYASSSTSLSGRRTTLGNTLESSISSPRTVGEVDSDLAGTDGWEYVHSKSSGLNAAKQSVVPASLSASKEFKDVLPEKSMVADDLSRHGVVNGDDLPGSRKGGKGSLSKSSSKALEPTISSAWPLLKATGISKVAVDSGSKSGELTTSGGAWPSLEAASGDSKSEGDSGWDSYSSRRLAMSGSRAAAESKPLEKLSEIVLKDVRAGGTNPSPSARGKGSRSGGESAQGRGVLPSAWQTSLPSAESSSLRPTPATAGTNSRNGTQSSVLGKLLPHEPDFPIRGSSSSTIRPLPSLRRDTGMGFISEDPGDMFADYPDSLSQSSSDGLDSDSASLDSFDSQDECDQTHESKKQIKWFRAFFQEFDLLTLDEILEHVRQWHCPACQGGVGAIDWYRGLQPLLSHAKNVRSKRVKLHKVFVEILEEEIRTKGAAPAVHGSGKYGKWKGLADENENNNPLIVWPPMVIIQNTQLAHDDSEKWMGMGNRELIDMFKKYNPAKARHSYGPQGHRGMSVLIFTESPTGYYDAQRLEKHFKDACRGRDNWNFAGKRIFQHGSGGERILYGYLATPADLEIFDRHCRGKAVLKWDQRRLHDMVLGPMRKMDEENLQVTYLQDKFQREMKHSLALKKTMSVIMKKLHLREGELQVIRDRAREQHQQQETEMDDLENLYKAKIDQLRVELEERENSVQKMHEEYEQKHIQQCQTLESQKDMSGSNGSQQQQQTLVEEEIEHHSNLVEQCLKNQEDYETQKVQLLQDHHQRMMDFKLRQWEELLDFERKMEEERLLVLAKYSLPMMETEFPTLDASKNKPRGTKN